MALKTGPTTFQKKIIFIFSIADSGEMESSPNAKLLRRPHLCEHCGKSYTQLPGLKYHMQSVHGISDQASFSALQKMFLYNFLNPPH
jgi:hypothetical protein